MPWPLERERKEEDRELGVKLIKLNILRTKPSGYESTLKVSC